MSRACAICNLADQAAVRAAFAGGGSDRALAQHFNLSHMAVGRHRRSHLVGPMRAAVAALDKGRAIRQQREEQLVAIERGDPLAIFKLDAIATDLARIAQRLDLSADAAAGAGLHGAHAQLAGQLLRQTEIRARIGGHDKPAPTGNEAAQSFSVQIVFSGGAVERISTVPGVAIDAEQGDQQRGVSPDRWAR